jgi:hypothetical protein
MEVYKHLPAHNDAIFQPPTLSPTPSSSQLPASSGPEKSVLSRAIFKLQTPMVSPAPTSVVTALETRSESVDSTKNHQKTEKSSALKSGLNQLFCHIWENRDRNRSTIKENCQKTELKLQKTSHNWS